MGKINVMQLEARLTETLAGAPVQVACRLRQVMNIWAWLIVQLSTVNGVELGEQKLRDALFL